MTHKVIFLSSIYVRRSPLLHNKLLPGFCYFNFCIILCWVLPCFVLLLLAPLLVNLLHGHLPPGDLCWLGALRFSFEFLPGPPLLPLVLLLYLHPASVVGSVDGVGMVCRLVGSLALGGRGLGGLVGSLAMVGCGLVGWLWQVQVVRRCRETNSN